MAWAGHRRRCASRWHRQPWDKPRTWRARARGAARGRACPAAPKWWSPPHSAALAKQGQPSLRLHLTGARARAPVLRAAGAPGWGPGCNWVFAQVAPTTPQLPPGQAGWWLGGQPRSSADAAYTRAARRAAPGVTQGPPSHGAPPPAGATAAPHVTNLLAPGHMAARPPASSRRRRRAAGAAPNAVRRLSTTHSRRRARRRRRRAPRAPAPRAEKRCRLRDKLREQGMRTESRIIGERGGRTRHRGC